MRSSRDNLRELLMFTRQSQHGFSFAESPTFQKQGLSCFNRLYRRQLPVDMRLDPQTARME
jgi:hypothetical protein